MKKAYFNDYGKISVETIVNAIKNDLKAFNPTEKAIIEKEISAVTFEKKTNYFNGVKKFGFSSKTKDGYGVKIGYKIDKDGDPVIIPKFGGVANSAEFEVKEFIKYFTA